MTAESPTTPEVGQAAPAVVLPDVTGKVHDLAEQRGRWTVLYSTPSTRRRTPTSGG